MKKSLVLAMAMALGISATAFAANPFSDLPSGHWAYASVAKLAAAGVVDGYPDGTFKGDKLMTRYEMAQIVAKALAKGAIGADDKLVSEFADELNNLGVRVAKLEKNADNVKITGQVRYMYADVSGDLKDYRSSLRSRIFFTGEINDNWHYQGMLQNQQDLSDDDGNGETEFQRANIYGNIGAVKVTAGRFDNTISNGYTYDDRVDGIKAEFGKNVKVVGEYGKMSNDPYGNDGSSAGKYWRAGVSGKVGNNFDLHADYIDAKDVYTDWMKGDDKIWAIGADYNVDKLHIGAEYLKGDNEAVDRAGGSQTGWVASVGYAGAQAAKVNSWGVYANYYNQGASTYIAHTMNGVYNDADSNFGNGFKGFMVGANYTVAKNMVATVEYYDLKDKENDLKAKTLWSQLVITF